MNPRDLAGWANTWEAYAALLKIPVARAAPHHVLRKVDEAAKRGDMHIVRALMAEWSV